MRYYAVTAKRGHCGVGRYNPIKFVFCADNLIDAMDLAKRMPGVKHTEMILNGEEISFEEYRRLRKQSAYERAGT